jgi:hypothetical protein
VGDNADVGELRGRPDQTPEEPNSQVDGDHVGPPGPEWNNTRDGNKYWRVMRATDDFVMPGESGPDKSRLRYEKPSPDDRPAERPPSGEELVEAELDDASLTDKLEKRLLEKDTLDGLHDVVKHTGKDAGELLFGDRPPTHSEVCVPMPTKEHLTPGPGMDGGELLTGMLVAGIAIGEGVKRVYAMRHAEKEGGHGRFG